MKTVIGTSLTLLFLCGCGEQPERLDLHEGHAEHFSDGALGEACNDPITASLIPAQVIGYSPKLKFVSRDRETYLDAKVDPHMPNEGRCVELRRHFSGMAIVTSSSVVPNELSIEMGFSPTAEQEAELLQGKTVSVRPDEANFVVTDGSLNSASTDLELRCPGSASVSCRVKDLGGYKKCDAYEVKFAGLCSFRANLLLYSFADHKKAQLEVMGELKTSEHGDGEIKFTKVSWLDVN